jgi:hypothetical protein
MTIQTLERTTPYFPEDLIQPEWSEAERREHLLQRACDIIHGRVQLEPFVPDADAVEIFDRRFAGYDPPPSPTARDWHLYQMMLQFRYAGKAILCHVDEIGAVLATEEQEILDLLQRFTPEEHSRVIITYP